MLPVNAIENLVRERSERGPDEEAALVKIDDGPRRRTRVVHLYWGEHRLGIVGPKLLLDSL